MKKHLNYFSDEREGLPSASGADRWVNCPASFLLESQFENEENESMKEGTMLHEIMQDIASTEDGVGNEHAIIHYYSSETNVWLSEEQNKAIIDCMSARREAIKAVGEIVGADPTSQVIEKRLWLHNFADKLYSSKLDNAIYYSSAESALIIDYKFGRGEVGSATSNLQLRAQALCLWQDDHQLKRIFVCIIQPRGGKFNPETDLCEYDVESLNMAYAQLSEAAKNCMTENATVKKGSHCKYCRAKSICPLVKQNVDEILILKDNRVFLPVTSEELDRIELAECLLDSYAKTRRLEAIQLLETNPDALKGWKLKKGTKSKKVENVAQAFTLLCDSLSSDQFIAACSLSLPDLAEVYKKEKGSKSVSEARKEIEEKLNSIIITKEGNQKLVKE